MMSFCTPRNQPYMKDTLFKKYPRKSKSEREREREREKEREEKGRRDGDRGGRMERTGVRGK